MTDRSDYIIVGAGSAGCVLASRLTEDTEVNVYLIEAGPGDTSWEIHMPAAFSRPLNSDRFNWAYRTEPEPFLNNRVMDCPRGRVVGGSSSINGMCYVRGHAFDYDRWAEETGDPNWAYAHCLPYFRKAETRDSGENSYHGGEGPLRVTTGAIQNPLYQAFIDAGVQAGYGYTEDQNGFRQEGFGTMDMTVANGARWSAAKGYLKPALARKNLTMQKRALVTRVLFTGNRATGVEIVENNKLKTIYAERAVILCGGVINSPQILQLSGIGNPELLQQHGIPVIAELNGVGENLQDHLEVYVQYECIQPVSLAPALRLHRQAKILLEWLTTKKGLGASNHFEAGAFIRSRAGVRHPDLQFHFLPVAVNYDGTSGVKGHGFQAHMGPMRATSRGYVRISSNDPRKPPRVLFNYMQTDQDRQEMRDGVRLTREIMNQEALNPFRGTEISPGTDVQSDDEIDGFVRARAESAYHPACTCKMGNDEAAVVDSQGRVHGVENLRVIDSSIMPSIVSGNLNAPVIMMAEKLADILRGRQPFVPSDAPVFQAENWETRQRESL